jgi:tetratricopeptide (TPR) repeat protein
VAELVKQACAISDDDSREDALGKIDAALAGADEGALIAERVAGVTGFAPATTGLQETFWAIRRFLEWLGRDRPVVVSVDDLQWAEPTFLDLVEYLVGWSRDVALLVLALARPDLMDLRPAWGSGTPNASTQQLDPLADDDSHRLITVLLDGARLEEQAAERIADSAGGNPLFLEEMLRMLEDDGLLRRGEGGWIVAGDLLGVALPASIQALLGARLDRLGPDERDVIRSAAVIGRVFWWGAIAELVPEPVRSRVGGHLQTLVRKDLIRPERSSFSGEDAFRFHHILIQEAAYRATPKEIRADLHERFADWLGRTAGERATEHEEVIAYHLERASRYRRELGVADERAARLATSAAELLASAARRALVRGDVSAASDLLSRAGALYPEDHAGRRAILPDLGEALSEAGDLAGADAVLAEAIAQAERTGDAALRAHATIVRLLVLESIDPKRRTEAVTEVEALTAVLEGAGDELGLARAHRLLGDLYWVRSRYAAADAAFERALQHARRADAAWEEATILGQYTGSGIYGPVPTTVVAARCERVLAGSGGMGTVEARALRALASIRAMEGRFDEARELAGRARSVLEELGLRLRAAFLSDTLGFIETLAGDPVAAERELRAGYDTIVELGERGFQSTVAAELARALVALGRFDEAEVLTNLSEDLGAEDDLATQVMWRGARARIMATRGQTDTAIALARESVSVAGETDDLNMQGDANVDLGEVLRLAGGDEDAARAFDEALVRYEAKGNVVGARDAARRRASLDAPV